MTKNDNEMSLQEACNQTRQFGKFLKGMERLQEAANALENSEAVVRENDKRIKDLNDERVKAEAALAAVAAKLEAANAALKAAIEAATTKASEIVADAKRVAGEITVPAEDALAALNAKLKLVRAEVVSAEGARDAALADELAVRERTEKAKAAVRAALV